MAENLISSPAYRVAFSMYVALGGDPNTTFDSVDAIYAAIDELYGKGTRVTIENLSVEITENGGYLYDNEEITGYKPVSVNVSVPQKYTDEQVESLKETARQEGYDSGYDLGVADGFIQGESEGYNDGYAEGLEDGAADQKELLEAVTFTENGTYTKEDGYNQVTVAVEMPEIPTFETEELSIELTKNGTYNYTPTTDGYSKVDVTVNVASSGGGGLDWSASGYSEDAIAYCNSTIEDDIAYIKTALTKFNNAGTSSNKNQALRNDGRLVYAPVIICANTVTKARDVFSGCGALKYVPRFSAAAATDVNYSYGLFGSCVALRRVDRIELPKSTSCKKMFYDCLSLEYVPLFDTSGVVSMEEMFAMSGYLYPNTALTTVPLFDTSKVQTMYNMFKYCEGLTTVPLFNTSSLTNSQYMFNGCSSLTTVPLFNLSNVTTMANMFEACTSLTTIPQFDTSSATNMTRMFSDCKALTAIPSFNSGKVTNMATMCQNTISLQSIGELDCSSVTNIGSFFGSSSTQITTLTSLGGFKNLGQQSSVSGTNDYYFLYKCPNLTHDAILNVINGLYDRTTAGYTVLTLKLNSKTLALLSDEDIAIATNKGWTIS